MANAPILNIPMIRLEVEGMKHTVLTALTEHAALMDASIQGAVEAYCTPGNIDSVVQKAARDAIDAAVKEEVRSFFGYSGNGRKALHEAVQQWLNDVYPLKD